MNNGVLNRLRRLEARRPDGIIVEASFDGITQKMSVPEFVARGGVWPDAKIISGSDLSDLDLLLATVKSVID